ncbi:MAG: UvrD-helicase domain-containing protein, partial [Planctomycetes bacterium]|nr:UvrD-helicase domain-containing protein [Planctomycetota bacterium]
MSDPLLADLTAAQLEAVTHLNGPMLVVAGAGSGKTRVVTRRIARLVAMGIKPWRILALTFTNKAAREMRDRVEQLVGEAPAWMGTFHSVCARMLRFDIHLLEAGRDNRFSIMDQGDQEGLVKQALKSLDIDDKSNKPSALLAAISKAKSDFISPEDFIPGSWKDEITHKVYIEYERLLRLNNAVDFDDLLVLAARLLQQSPAALMKYRNRFPHILVDEYQDTNRAQYRLLKALAGEQANLHATGDPDQSIYSWRGADYRNIMDFQNDFPGAKVVRLEENYRSSQNILAAANQLIRHNSHRLDKDLFTANPKGEPVMDVALQSDRMEALWIAERMSEMRLNGDRLGQMAVFYRTNAQSRALEEALMAKGIAYQLVGGVRFYERREIKDLLAHLKVRINPRDLGSLRRVVSCRPGIGDKTLDKIAAAASEAGETTMAFLASDDFPDRFKAAKKVVDFAKWCRELMAIDVSRADVAAKAILNHSGLIETMLAATGKDDLAEDRLENLHSLTARAGDFVRDRLENAPVQDEDADAEEIRSSQAIDLAAFLEDVALVADVDGWASDSDKATLMTLHSAKGLEFDAVFVAGLEEGMLPHRNCRTDEALEEERRLFYVGLTRARKRAFVTHAQTRYIHGLFDISIPSRFLEELPSGPVEKLDFADAISTEYGSGYFTDSLDAAKKRAGSGPFKAYDFDADFAQPDADFDFDIAGDFDPNPDFQPDPEPGFPDFLPPPEKRATPPAKGGLSWRPV